MSDIPKAMRDVQRDCEQDATGIDGKPFTGRTVAEQFGNTLAMLAAVARAVELLAERLEPPDREVGPQAFSEKVA